MHTLFDALQKYELISKENTVVDCYCTLWIYCILDFKWKLIYE